MEATHAKKSKLHASWHYHKKCKKAMSIFLLTKSTSTINKQWNSSFPQSKTILVHAVNSYLKYYLIIQF